MMKSLLLRGMVRNWFYYVGARRSIFCSLSMLAVSADLITNTTDRSNQRMAVAGIHFAPQVVDVHVHYIGHRVVIEFPDLFDDDGAGDGLAFVAHQAFQQGELLRAEIDIVAAPANRTADPVKLKISDLEQRPSGAAAATQNGANACREFGEREGLRDIIIGAGIKAPDTLFDHAGIRHH